MQNDEIKAWVADPQNLQSKLPQDILVGETLASGGQGVVLRGTVHSAPAAIKVYFPGQVQKRIDREIEAIKSLDCEEVVSLLWSGQLEFEGKVLYCMATELVDGKDLETLIQTSGAQGLETTTQVVCDVSRAIGALWAKRIVHRDIKPPNVIVQPTGRAKVIDLGVARHMDLSSMTAAGATWGTVGYLSPEQACAKRNLTLKSDIYTLGVVALECILGRHPTYGNQMTLLQTDWEAQQFSGELEKSFLGLMIKKMLHHRPTRRPHVREILSALEKN